MPRRCVEDIQYLHCNPGKCVSCLIVLLGITLHPLYPKDTEVPNREHHSIRKNTYKWPPTILPNMRLTADKIAQRTARPSYSIKHRVRLSADNLAQRGNLIGFILLGKIVGGHRSPVFSRVGRPGRSLGNLVGREPYVGQSCRRPFCMCFFE